jgi:hypothetical protein
MVKLQSESRRNKESIISGHLVACDKDGITEQTEEVAEILLSAKYDFLEFKIFGEEIKKVEVVEPLEVEKGEPIETPNIEPTTPEEELEKLEEEETSFEDMISGIDKINELKEIAQELGLPKQEWEGYKRLDYFKAYLIKATSVEEEKTETEN